MSDLLVLQKVPRRVIQAARTLLESYGAGGSLLSDRP
jgi:hypothetical protein